MMKSTLSRGRVRLLAVCFATALLSTAGVVLAPTPARAQSFQLESPDHALVVAVDAPAEGALTYNVKYKGQAVLAPSALGVVLNDQNIGQKVRMRKPTQRSVDEKYTTYGVHGNASSQYQEAKIPLQGGAWPVSWTLELRVFNDGMAYRYRIPGQGTRRIDGEESSWKVPAGSTVWYQSERNKDYEAPYQQATVGDLATGTALMAPATIKLPGGLGYAMMTEANLVNYSDMSLAVAAPGTFKALFTNDPRGWAANDEIVSPWRVTLISPNLNGLVNSDIVKNLCPPPAKELANAPWIRPGRSLWHWLVTGPPRFSEQRQWVDWTKQLGFEYYLIDDGWKRWNNGGKDAWANLKEIVDYAKSQNVAIFAWVHSNEVFTASQRASYLEKAKAAGLVGLKIDFPQAANVDWVNWYDDMLRDMAQHQLLVDFHGALKPTGRERTWPHELTREAIRGRENGKQTSLHDTTLPFLRYVQGPADFTPAELQPDRINKSSWGHELAQAVVYTSPFLCYGGSAQDFLKNPAREVIKAIPATWDETVVLPGSEIGQVAAFARRKGDDWFIGVVNGADARTLSIDLRFLGSGDYQAEQFGDSPDRTDGWTQSRGAVSSKTSLSVNLRADGGYVARITKTR